MKTTITILATLFILQINFLFAGNDGIPLNTNKEMNFRIILLLAPVTPREATFEDVTPLKEVILLSPVTPKEASFEDESEDLTISLAPEPPSEADFDDDDALLNADVVSLAPSTPATADFTDLP
jgi:hypothetical protein